MLVAADRIKTPALSRYFSGHASRVPMLIVKPGRAAGNNSPEQVVNVRLCSAAAALYLSGYLIFAAIVNFSLYFSGSKRRRLLGISMVRWQLLHLRTSMRIALHRLSWGRIMLHFCSRFILFQFGSKISTLSMEPS